MIGFICGCLIGIILTYILLSKKIKRTQYEDKKAVEYNELLNKNKEELFWEIRDLQQELNNLVYDKNNLMVDINNLSKQILIDKDDAVSKVEKTYKEALTTMMNSLSNAAELESKKYQEAKRKMEDEFLNLQEEFSKNYLINIEDKQKELLKIQQQLTDCRSKVAAAVAASKREEEIKNKHIFYTINLSVEDSEEIKKLREVAACLRDSEPLNKIIWKVYYEKPFTDLIGRVLGSSNPIGIYKITNRINQKCYVGQTSAGMAVRWKQHAKRGTGAETPNNNKLYPAMLKYGIENFTFEVIEECSKELLNEREQYWQDYFKAKEFGYSIK